MRLARGKYYVPVDVAGTRVRFKAQKEERQRKDRDRYASDPLYRLRQIARSTARNALLRGDISQELCVKCGSDKSQMHHRDYDWPLDVVWLCGVCHKLEHGGSFKNGTKQNRS